MIGICSRAARMAASPNSAAGTPSADCAKQMTDPFSRDRAVVLRRQCTDCERMEEKIHWQA